MFTLCVIQIFHLQCPSSMIKFVFRFRKSIFNFVNIKIFFSSFQPLLISLSLDYYLAIYFVKNKTSGTSDTVVIIYYI